MASSESSGVTTGQPNLQKQDLSKLDVTKLTALSPEVISRQATINIGTIGHVAHGKSTVVKAISGVQTVRFKNELERNITIKLEKLQFDENGTVTWPSHVKGYKTDVDHAVGASENFKGERRGIKRKLRKHGKPRPNKDRETYAKEYVVEKILAQELDPATREHMFLVKWKGYSVEHNTWEPLEHLTHCTLMLTQFLAETLGSQVLDKLCERLNVSSSVSDQDLLEILKIHDLRLLPDKLTLQQKLLRVVATPPQERHIHKLEEGKRAILTYQLVLKREEQLKKLKDWEDMINEKSKEEAAITVENTVDLECLPEGFIYINEYVATDDIVIPDNPEVGCDCDECGPKLKMCCGRQPYNGFTFKKGLRVNVNPGTPIYECNKLCKCGPGCRNRVVQNGRKIPLCIFRTSNGCGWGVKAKRKIHCGEFVCEYVGEVITHEEAETRGQTYDQEGRTYLFDLDYNSRDNPYTVDAAKYGNISHFINHSCDPNLGVYAVWINCRDPNLPKLALFALREIERDEEITFDYMMNIDPVVPTTPEKSRFLHTPDKDQNKIDLVKEGQAKEQHEQIVKFVQGTVAEGAPIIPISAQLKYNIEVLCEYITKKIPVPVRDFTSEPRLIVIRSFDVNKPGCEVDDLKGGVAGGSILRGVLKVGQEIEVRPGLVSKDSEGKLTCRPIFSRIVSLYTEQNELQFAVPGGLIGVGTKIEPTLCRADRLVGQVLGAVGALPSIFIELEVSYYLLKRLLGVRTEGDKKGAKVQRLSKGEVLLVNIGSLSTGGRVVATKADLCKISLTNPVCTEIGEKIALSRRVEKHWRLIGWGQIRGGETIDPSTN
ncbi:hypothetical protein NQ315_005419 [Exocentrus adspersus]|uniref:Protein-synthesizing GTPase n=1 Tax=Exocentrus adspersus TaxID=1586481 RepID=A0AAV8W2J0_9CUCU|nr:hypothetical protein NQ315_005419 [Exocentrus adspersus]